MNQNVTLNSPRGKICSKDCIL